MKRIQGVFCCLLAVILSCVFALGVNAEETIAVKFDGLDVYVTGIASGTTIRQITEKSYASTVKTAVNNGDFLTFVNADTLAVL